MGKGRLWLGALAAHVIPGDALRSYGHDLGAPVNPDAPGVIKCPSGLPTEARTLILTEDLTAPLQFGRLSPPVEGECVAVNTRSTKSRLLAADFKSGWILRIHKGSESKSESKSDATMYHVTRPYKGTKARALKELRCFEESACPATCAWDGERCLRMDKAPAAPAVRPVKVPRPAYVEEQAGNTSEGMWQGTPPSTGDERGSDGYQSDSPMTDDEFGGSDTPPGMGNLVHKGSRRVAFRDCAGGACGGYEPVVDECVGVKSKSKRRYATRGHGVRRKYKVSVLASIIGEDYYVWQPPSTLKEKEFDDLAFFSPTACPADCVIQTKEGVDRCMRDF